MGLQNYIYISRNDIKGGCIIDLGEKELDESIKIEKAIDNKNLFNFLVNLILKNQRI